MSGHIKGELLAVYRDLAPDERARADAHAAGCPSCAETLARLQRVDAHLERLPEIPVPAGLLARLPVTAGQRTPRERPDRFGLALARLLGPAAVALLVIIGLWLALSSGGRIRSVATATPTYTLTPTATLVTQVLTPREGGASLVQVAPVASAPLPASLPAPGQRPGLASRPASLFFVALEPRATIVR